jgi:DNA mismatch endonuclease (patch repair protein)
LNLSNPIDPSVSRRMSQAVSTNTKPELMLRQALHRAGRRFRVQYRVPGLPRRSVDIAFTRSRVAVMVDGCFWHACPEHASWPRNNAEWWRDKLEANVARDRETDRRLEALGWIVVRVWEHEPTGAAVEKVLTAIDQADVDRRMVA